MYNELINQATGSAVLQASGNTFVTTPGTQIRIGDKYLKPDSGVLFIKAAQLTITLGDARLEVVSASGILDVAKGIFVVTAGEVSVGEQKVTTNSLVQISAQGNTIADFDRSIFNSDSTYAQLISYLVEQQMASDSLKDLIAPELSGLSPTSGSSTEATSFTLTGKTEAGAKLFIDGAEVSLDSEGMFEKKIDLTLGENSFELVVTDQLGNSAKLSYVITRNAPPEPCKTGVFKPDLICLINQYREANGLNMLSEDIKLSTTASDHSDWMAANGTLSHTGINSSAPWDRCNSHGTTCDSETLAMNSSPTANNIFNQWRNSADHNAVLLGSHNFIGIGITSGYVTGVFR